MTYSEPLAAQLSVPALFLGVGFLLGLLFEFCRFVRVLFAGETLAAVRAQDVVFCVLSFFVLFLSFLAFSDGRLRLHLFFAAFAGFLAFRLTLGKPLRLLLGRLSSLLIAAAQTLLRPFVTLSERSRTAFARGKSAADHMVCVFQRRFTSHKEKRESKKCQKKRNKMKKAS